MVTIAKWMVSDIKMAFECKTSVLDSNWIYSVEPETMSFIKSIWLSQKEDTSLFSVFCKYLKNEFNTNYFSDK
jgi:hypothetical protein